MRLNPIFGGVGDLVIERKKGITLRIMSILHYVN